MVETRFTLIWPDGSIITGGSYRECEDMIRAGQWRLFRSRRWFRRALAHRAHVWSGRSVSVRGSSERFLTGLAAVGMFMLVDGEAVGCPRSAPKVRS